MNKSTHIYFNSFGACEGEELGQIYERSSACGHEIHAVRPERADPLMRILCAYPFAHNGSDLFGRN